MIIKAKVDDIKEIMGIINLIVKEMKAESFIQWDENYPTDKDFLKDIVSDDLYIYKEDGFIKGFICINYIEAEEYNDLVWSNNEKSMVIHRMAVNPKFRNIGIASKLINFAEELSIKNKVTCLKTDTYSKNIKMNSLFKKLGFKYVGDVYFREKAEAFYCYEKVII